MGETNIGTIAVNIRAKNGQLIAGLKGANKAITGFASKFKADFGAIALVGGAAAVAFGATIVKITQSASNLEEAQAKFDTVFRGSTEAAQAFANELQEGYALSETAAKTFLGNIQDTLVPMGLAREEATQLSGEIVKLAADLGSFNNVPTETVVRDLQSALVGNTETVKKYGVVLKATDIQQLALLDSGKKNVANLTQSEKVTAAYKLILEGTTDAQGDFKRTSDGFANTQKKLNSAMTDFMATLGQFTVGPGASLLDWLSRVVKNITSVIKSLATATSSWLEFKVSIEQAVVVTLRNASIKVIQFIQTLAPIGKALKLVGVDLDGVSRKIQFSILKLNQQAQTHLKTVQQRLATERLRAQREAQIKKLEAQKKIETDKLSSLERIKLAKMEAEEMKELKKETDEFNAQALKDAAKHADDVEKRRADSFQQHRSLLTSISNESESAMTAIFDKNLSDREKRQKLFSQVMGILQRQLTSAVISGMARQQAATVATSQVETQAKMAPTAAGYFSATAGIPFVGQAIALGFIAAAFAFINRVAKFQEGGVVGGLGRRDSVPALLTPGERVLTREENRAFEGGALKGGGATNVTINISGQFLEADETKWRAIFKKVLGEVQRQTMISPTSNFIRRRGATVG